MYHPRETLPTSAHAENATRQTRYPIRSHTLRAPPPLPAIQETPAPQLRPLPHRTTQVGGASSPSPMLQLPTFTSQPRRALPVPQAPPRQLTFHPSPPEVHTRTPTPPRRAPLRQSIRDVLHKVPKLFRRKHTPQVLAEPRPPMQLPPSAANTQEFLNHRVPHFHDSLTPRSRTATPQQSRSHQASRNSSPTRERSARHTSVSAPSSPTQRSHYSLRPRRNHPPQDVPSQSRHHSPASADRHRPITRSQTTQDRISAHPQSATIRSAPTSPRADYSGPHTRSRAAHTTPADQQASTSRRAEVQVPPAASSAPRTRLQTAKQLFLPKRFREHFVMHSRTHNPRMGEEFLDPAFPRGFKNGHQPQDWRVLDTSWTPHQHQKWSLQWFPRRNRIGVYAVAPVTSQPSILRRTHTVHTHLFPASDAVRTGSDFPPGSDSVVTTTGSDSSAASAGYDRISPSESSAIRVSEPAQVQVPPTLVAEHTESARPSETYNQQISVRQPCNNQHAPTFRTPSRNSAIVYRHEEFPRSIEALALTAEDPTPTDATHITVHFATLENMQKAHPQPARRRENSVYGPLHVGDVTRYYNKRQRRYVTALIVSSRDQAPTLDNLRLAIWNLHVQAIGLEARHIHMALPSWPPPPYPVLDVIYTLDQEFISSELKVHLWNLS